MSNAIVTLEVNEEIAETLLKMEEICYGEGIGPDTSYILGFIRQHFPLLSKRYSYLYPSNASQSNPSP